jgi:predicted dehydrogenase
MKLGVIGNGARMGGLINGPFLEAEPDLRVVGVVDPDEPGARSRLPERDRPDAVFYRDAGEMIRRAKPDALAIGTRCNLHAPLAIAVASSGIPLYLEKPIATSREQAIALERAYEHARTPVVVSFPLRVSPLAVEARAQVEQGRIGSPEHALGFNYVPYGTVYFDQFYRDFSVTQGLFLQKATHDFDCLMYLMGASIVRVAAMWTRGRVFGGDKPAGLRCSACPDTESCAESPANRRRGGSGGTLLDHLCVFGRDVGDPATGMNEDSSSALLEFATGAHGAYTQVFYSGKGAASRGATLSGYRGTLSFDWYRNELHLARHQEPFTDTVRAAEGMSHFGGDLELARNFAAVVRGRSPSLAPLAAGLASIYTCLAAKEAAETGTSVKVRQVGAAGGST